MEGFYSKSLEEIAKELNTNLQKGLTSQEAEKRLLEYGPNALKEKGGKNPLVLFFKQFTNFLVIILIIAAIVSFLLGERIDGAMIVAIICINAVVGFIQEYRVEKAIEHLKRLVSSETEVYRDGQLMQISSHDLVPGDLMIIEEGQRVTADIRLIQTINLQTMEAPLTGESTPVNKNTTSLSGEIAIADQQNMLFSGTTIASGKGMGIVTSTGMKTEIGKIAHLVSAEKDPQTPMQQKLNRLGSFIGKLILVVAAVVGAEEMFFGGQNIIDAFISAVALAVAAIPEGLPAVVTISLALGTRRLLKQKALVRNLPAAETLGSTNVICSDKTGTLTEGKMSVRQIFVNDHTLIEFGSEAQKILKMGILASNARQVNNSKGEKIIGDPTEAALISAAIESGINQNQLITEYTRVLEVPFSSIRKMMTIAVKDQDKQWVISKGATEVILNHCTKIEKDGEIKDLTDVDRKRILSINEQMAGDALRVLAFAQKWISQASEKNAESDLVFVGLQGMMDPPREGVKDAIEVAQKQAGIRVIMITGDHLLTAQAVAREIGVLGKSITGEELSQLSDDEFRSQVEDIGIYARVDPEHKIRIVKALKENGYQVAMTGDGVNDAPALKAADIGVAMGITGTDVSKDSSDIILLDDNFTTITSAVREGRAIYDNIRKFVNYLLTSNLMEVLVIFLAVIFGWPLPLLPIHLLWINLVTDGLPAIALGVDPPRANIMSFKPQIFKEEIISVKFLKMIIFISSVLTIAILGIFAFTKGDIIYGQTMVFTAVVLYEMIRIVVIRQEYHLPFFSNKFLTLAILTSIGLQFFIMYTPFTIFGTSLQTLFRIQALNLADWVILIGVGVILLLVMKIFENRIIYKAT
jgi:P-type Ca2+ transporter type 2C